MKLFQVALPVLQGFGVDTAFGVMGDGNLRFVADMAAPGGLAYYAARHESAAVCMARGYAHATGHLGVATVTEGPGITNALTALVEAVRAREPVLLLAGDTPTTMRRHNQDIDQATVARSLGIAVERVRAPQTFAEDLGRAAQRALLESTAVVVSVPTDWQTVDVSSPRALLHEVRPSLPSPDPAVVESVVESINQSSRPVILVGRGVRDPASRGTFDALADRTGALLTTSLVAKGFFTGNPFDLGVAGGMASNLAVDLLSKADLVLAFGCSLSHWTTRAGTLFAKDATVVQCDVNPGIIGDTIPVDIPVVADGALFAHAVLGRLTEKNIWLTGFRTSGVRTKIQDWRPQYADDSRPGCVDPRHLTVALENLIPTDRTIVQDGGHFCGWAPSLMSVPDHRAFDWGQSYMSVGLGIGAAIGAAVGRPERRTVLLAGDGGLMMSLGDLESVSRLGLPMLVIVYNDAAYLAEVAILEALEMSTAHAYFKDVDLASLARSVGFSGHAIRRLDDLNQLASEITDPSTRVLLDCKVNPAVRGDWFNEAFGRDSWLERMSATDQF
jgi:thiamine pyrophosphate-dependent acetolactate synthase large subunit-like protein